MRLASLTVKVMMMASISGLLLASGAGASPDAVYGLDNRRDLFDAKGKLGTKSIASLASATVIIARKEYLEPQTDGSFKAKTVTLRELMETCPEVKFAHQPTLGACSGTLIAPNLVLTASHCLHSYLSLPEMAFVFGFKMLSAGSAKTTFTQDEVYFADSILFDEWDPENHDPAKDIALVKLNRKVTRPFAKLLPDDLRLEKAEQGVPVALIGYPDGLPAKFTDDAEILSLGRGFARANLDSFSGNSGAPVFNAKNGKILGILTSGNQDYSKDPKRECNVLNTFPRNQPNEVITPIDAVLPKLPPNWND